MRKILFILVGCLLLASCSSGTGNTSSGGAAMGDTVQVEYVGKFTNGTVFDTNVQSVAEANGINKSSYGPMEITVGQGQVIQGFDNALIGMTPDQEKTVTLSPGQAYGQENPQKIININVEQSVDRFNSYQRDVNLPISRFNQLPGNHSAGDVVEVGDIAYEILSVDNESAQLRLDVEEDDKIQLPNTYWNSTIVEVNDTSYRVRQDPEDGAMIKTPFGMARIDVSNETLTRTLLIEEGGAVQTQQGVGRITSVNETDAVINFNHPMAGKTLVFDIKRVE